MSTSLPASVEALSLQSTEQRSQIPGCFPTLNPMDIYREHIATEISKVLGVDAQKIYPRIAWTSTLDKGDLSLPVRDTCRVELFAGCS
jgi:arginyl-tRNA synthetase